MKIVLRCSRFKPLLHSHGGAHRTAQLEELLVSHGCKVKDIPPSPSGWPWLLRYYNASKFLLHNNFKISPKLSTINFLGNQITTMNRSLEKLDEAHVLIWEHTALSIVPYFAKEKKIAVVAAPQNLESLVSDNVDFFSQKKAPEYFFDEIEVLSHCSKVFCISREEQWLLKQFDIDAAYLPYYPCRELIQDFLDIREKRNESLKGGFLIVGSASNPPTFEGMKKQIEMLDPFLEQESYKVDIVGLKTETLKYFSNNPYFHFHGRVETKELNEKRISAKAVLIHQNAGVGALTRIPEMLMCGIPVIASSNAARSYFGYSGLYVYDSEEELYEYMRRDLPVPEIPSRPVREEKRFLKTLESLSRSKLI